MKARPSFLPLLLVLLVLPLASPARWPWSCKPGRNCKLPNCRCWSDASIPGGIEASKTPQMVLLTFQYAVSRANDYAYQDLFNGLTNPNGCPALGTFFVQEANTDFEVVKDLSDYGHEIGLTSIDGTTPDNRRESWEYNIQRVYDDLLEAGVPEDGIVGFRAPEMAPGGSNEYNALSRADMMYDASCVTNQYIDSDNLLWPFTYDWVPGPECEGGNGPDWQRFRGMWEVMVPVLEYNGTRCSTPQGCTNVQTESEVFDLFYNNFVKRYKGQRSPFVIPITADWALDATKRAGTQKFLQYIRQVFDDTWILSVSQGLQWVKYPADNTVCTNDYKAWSCKKDSRAPAAAPAGAQPVPSQ